MCCAAAEQWGHFFVQHTMNIYDPQTASLRAVFHKNLTNRIGNMFGSCSRRKLCHTVLQKVSVTKIIRKDEVKII